MRMHHLQRFDASPLSVNVTDYSSTLRSLFPPHRDAPAQRRVPCARASFRRRRLTS
jgi:hypothetical protein